MLTCHDSASQHMPPGCSWRQFQAHSHYARHFCNPNGSELAGAVNHICLHTLLPAWHNAWQLQISRRQDFTNAHAGNQCLALLAYELTALLSVLVINIITAGHQH